MWLVPNASGQVARGNPICSVHGTSKQAGGKAVTSSVQELWQGLFASIY